ncbi:unnamed protein product [Gordionus sp. m RMFG-2023]|uniref:histone-lysine N-trimethyltransferase SMYD5-like n=1 Tax=Gordionus sp. m RMFG-2023 TaxID=3053472 RepID=UPI0030E09CBD
MPYEYFNRDEQRLITKDYKSLEKLFKIKYKNADDPPDNMKPLRKETIQEYYNDGKFLDLFEICLNTDLNLRTDQIWEYGVQSLIKLKYVYLAKSWSMQYFISTKHEEFNIEMLLIWQNIIIETNLLPLTKGLDIDIRTSIKGKGIYAKEGILTKGSTILREIPFVSCPNLNNPSIETYCSYCSKSILKCEKYYGDIWGTLDEDERFILQAYWPSVKYVKCDYCSWEYYCSQDCKRLSWQNYHQFICPGKGNDSVQLYDLCSKSYDDIDKKLWNAMFSPMLIVKLIILSLKELTTNPEKNSLKSINLGQHVLYRQLLTFSGSKYTLPRDKNSFVNIHAIVCKSLSSYGDSKLIIATLSLNDFALIYHKVANNVQSFNSTIYNSTLYNNFLKNLRSNNSHLAHFSRLIGKPISTNCSDQTFCGLFKLHACLNHDCNANATVEDLVALKCDNKMREGEGSDEGFGVLVRCRKPIMAGEEITIQYIDNELPKGLRRTWLSRAYDFDCQCLTCQFEGDKNICANCDKRAYIDIASNDGSSLESHKNVTMFKRCGQCLRAWYCSKECQKLHWNAGHKTICRKLESKTTSIDDGNNVLMSNDNIKIALPN